MHKNGKTDILTMGELLMKMMELVEMAKSTCLLRGRFKYYMY